MEILASRYLLPLPPLSIKSSSFALKSPSPNPNPNPIPKPKPASISCSVNASNYNGWDDLELLDGSRSSTDWLISLGPVDSKLAFTFSLGFFSALAVSKVRFSSMLVVPVSVLVFVGGFLAGSARFRVADEKVRDLESFLDGLMSELEKGTELSFDFLDRSKVEGYLEVIECMKKNVGGSIVGEILNGHWDFDSFQFGRTKKINTKSSKKRKELDFIQYIGALFQETPKVKDNSKGNATEQLNSVASGSETENQENAWIEGSELMFNKKPSKPKAEEKDKGRGIKTVVRLDDPVQNIEESTHGRTFYRSKDSGYANDMLSYEEELNNMNRSSRFTSEQQNFRRRVFKHNYERRLMQRDIGHYTNLGIDQRTTESMDFFTKESETSSLDETFELSDRTHNPSNRHRTRSLTKEPILKSEDQSVEATQQPVHGSEEGKTPSTSKISADEEFSRYMEEATNLLKKARECLRHQTTEETTESILYKSAKLLSAAEAIRPMSLLAVGQLGNTYLLHGELKLKISKELRTLLLRNDASLKGKGRSVESKKLNTCELSREDVETTLVEVCEECEVLLVEAGRKYRTALSIDGNDVRALYNWGLALSFRAQLVADIGPEAAPDADKIYLAAIDKFDAMMSRSDLYATDALYRWGTVLQQRSYLRPRNNREKVKLLHQAKSLFEDVLSVDSDNLQVREALVSCVSELSYDDKW
ncbi:uncharacterized protein A4U43_C01F9230 [Asparagus officinalis]|uniref:Uncharacterized protein n=1 Tax=Asparagus officinalis TaxID=4686 RepID=A0A5P1FNA3_ASPOF|nr:uncharacterized protein LOC109819953 [Asparagus officinalis]ONK79708.1 uncharacterized protein A4U43_C01F9230 [Asparagus officinalis]